MSLSREGTGSGPKTLIKPKILFTTTCRWLSAARLAAAFARTGCTIEAACPNDHSLELIRAKPRIHSYNVLSPVQSLRAAILGAAPDVVWPCDEQAMLDLHRLHEIESQSKKAGSAALRELIERAIGQSQNFPIIESRTRFLKLAREEGISTPITEVVASQEDVLQWLARHPLPAVLKADGTSAGEGVVIAHSAEEATAAYRRLNRPLHTAIVAKRAVFDRDTNSVPSWLLRRKREVSIQPFIPGADANIAVACWQGKVLSSISVEVVRRWKLQGPATIIRVLPDGEMLEAAKKLVRRLELSGLVGFDFMVEAKTGKYFLIEINARATQTAHLSLGRGRDLPHSLAAALGAAPQGDPEAITQNGEIALFPLAWRAGMANEWLKHAYHDVPWEEPELVRAGVAKESRITKENWDQFRSKLPFGKRKNEPLSLAAEAEEPRKFKVLHLIGSNLVGGPEKQILHHAEDLKESKYEIEIGSFDDQSERPEILRAAEERGLGTVCLKGGLRLDLVNELSGILRQRKGHLLCTHGFKANVVGYLAAKRTGALHIAFVRGWTAETMRVKAYEVLERQALKRAQWVVCVSEKQAERIARTRKKNTQPMVIPNAMLPPYSRGIAEITRASLGIAEGTFIFGSVGRLSAEKGHRFMISAFHQLCAASNGAVGPALIVVGDGREQEPLEAQAAELGIRDRVVFAGFQGSPANWMRLFGCLVQPSLTEGTPNSVLEALCVHVPVVATAVGGVPALVKDGENGLLVPAGDAGALAAAMKRMLESPELRERLIAGGAVVKEEYSIAGQRQKLITAYETAFGSRR